MSIVNALSRLKTNIFGGPGNTGFSRPPPSKVQDINMTNTPVSSLDSDPLKFGTYQFPKDVFENQQLGHYMVFYVNVQDGSKYGYGSRKLPVHDFDEPTGLQSQQARLRIKKNKTTGGNFASKQAGGVNLSESGRNSQSLQGLGAVRKTTTRIKDSIALYLPANVSDSTQAKYEDSPTGMLGVTLTDAIRGFKSFTEKDFEAAGKVAGKAMSEFAQETLKRLGGAMVESLAGAEGAVPLANKVFGRADNPFVEVFFNSMDIRTFTYNFIFAPRNEAETAEIQQIIQLFRYHMAPMLQGVNSRYLTLPSEFDIHYMYKAQDGQGYENDYFNRIGTCVLENVTTNYTPNGVKSFADGAPTQIKMDLTFRETEVLTKEKIIEGY
jgi:hypothetical protein